eukprot:29142-Pelagococcus_subviridis.AAC.3
MGTSARNQYAPQRHERLHRRRLGAVRRELLRAAFQLHVVVLPLRALQRLDLREVDGDGERERWVLRPGHQPALVLLALSLSHRRGFVDDVLLQTRHREFLRDGRYPHLTRDARAAAHDANLRQVAVPPPALHVPQHDVRFHEDVREHLVQRVFHRAVQAREVADVDHRRRHRLDRHRVLGHVHERHPQRFQVRPALALRPKQPQPQFPRDSQVADEDPQRHGHGEPAAAHLGAQDDADEGRSVRASDDIGVEFKGVRSGVERRRGVCVGIVSEGPWAERCAGRESP